MKKIKEIRIKNFKVFQEEEIFKINGKNVLIYGANGSGKSSLFWSLYTFVQSSEKENPDIEKYFRIYNSQDSKTHQTLRNVFVPDDKDSYIKLISNDVNTGKEDSYTISKNTINTNLDEDTLIRELNAASDFIDYRVLRNFYNGTNKELTNLWSVFERDIFPFLPSDQAESVYKEIKKGTNDVPRSPNGYPARNNSIRKTNFEQSLEVLNSNIQRKLGDISVNANKLLKKHFFDGEEFLKIQLAFDKTFNFDLVKQKIWDGKSRVFRQDNLRISLKVTVYDESLLGGNRTIDNVQSFLNEAQLTRIAIAIRLGALMTRPIKESTFKILVIDDLLISLDMSNRMEVMSLILNKEKHDELSFFDDLQKFIFTHDKGFYNLVRRNVNEKNWLFLKFKRDQNSNLQPKIRKELTSLQKAIELFEKGDFDECGNSLRKATENIINSYLDPEMKGYKERFVTLKKKIKAAKAKLIQEDFQSFKNSFKTDLDKTILEKLDTDFENDSQLSPEQKGKLGTLKRRWKNLVVDLNKREKDAEEMLETIESVLDRIMNPASHSSQTPIFEGELDEAIKKVQELKEHLSE